MGLAMPWGMPTTIPQGFLSNPQTACGGAVLEVEMANTTEVDTDLLEIGTDPEEWIDIDTISGLEMQVRYLSPEVIRGLRKRATSKVRNKSTRQMEDVVDDDKLAKAMVKHVVRDWRGMTVERLEQLVPLSAASSAKIKKLGKKGLPYSEDYLEVLLDNAYGGQFLQTVIEISMDLGVMKDIARERLSKNSGGSSDT
jgi:hypothetical protein